MMAMRHICALVATLLVLDTVAGYPAANTFAERLVRFLERKEVEERALEKRGAASVVQDIVFYDASGEKKTVSVKEACMFAHNLVREHHKETPDLKWDDNLANEAEKWALELAQSQNFRHSTTKHGENIYYQATMTMIAEGGPSPILSPAHAVFAWYQEAWEINGMSKPYNYNSENNPGAGHFTQIVWKDTHSVGCGVAAGDVPNPQDPSFMMTNTYIVANYEIPGNMMGEHTTMVMPLKDGAGNPGSAGDLEAVEGCVDYGPGCSMYSSMCSMAKSFCGCVCARK